MEIDQLNLKLKEINKFHQNRIDELHEELSTLIKRKTNIEEEVDYVFQDFLSLHELIETKLNKNKFKLYAQNQSAEKKLGIMKQRFETISSWIIDLNREVILG
jgi:hypothetical protein